MKNLFYALIGIAFLMQSCGEELIPDPEATNDVLIFGHFFGECWGEECIEIFRLDSEKLLEDIKDEYPGATDFLSLDFDTDRSDKRSLVANLLNKIPDSLLSSSEKVIGMPDAGDWGGIYVEVILQDQHDFWLIDHARDNLPNDELKNFRDEIVEAIELINQ